MKSRSLPGDRSIVLVSRVYVTVGLRTILALACFTAAAMPLWPNLYLISAITPLACLTTLISPATELLPEDLVASKSPFVTTAWPARCLMPVKNTGRPLELLSYEKNVLTGYYFNIACAF